MSDFSKTGLKSFFAYFNIVDKDNSGILEQDEVEGLSIFFCKRDFIYDFRGCSEYVWQRLRGKFPHWKSQFTSTSI